MSIQPGDKCDGCGSSFWDYEGTISTCPHCSSRYCDTCMEKIKKSNVCPACGRKANER